jgi:hypothetical protein
MMGGRCDRLVVNTTMQQASGPKAGVLPGMGVGLVLSHILMQAPVW